MKEIKEKALKWCKSPFDKKTQNDVKALFNYPNELENAFYKNLEFGTGGMRGIMGVGTNRINKYTLGKATQGLSLYLKNKFPKNKIKVVIAYDCRHNNELYSTIVSNILLANGIEVYLFSSLRTTPELSFSVRFLKANCGIVLTASHNPPEYNGFKVYWKDGGQIVPPYDEELMEKINSINYNEILFKGKNDQLNIIDKEIDNAFIDTSIRLAVQDDHKSKNIKIVFTSLHGTSIMSIPQVLKKAGHKLVTIIDEQSKPDGSFPTVKSPNPEEPDALELAINRAKKENADIVIGTDPDSDRIGIAVKNKKEKFIILNGNQTMLIMAHFILSKRVEKGLLNSKDYIASTIVSSPVMKKVAKNFGIECLTTLTGFKWISKEIEVRKSQNFIFGGEESLGYLIGDEIRDKDAVTSALLICEIAAILKTKDRTLYDFMIECYKLYTPYKERLISYKIEGLSGENKIKKMMQSFRNHPPDKINKQSIISIYDYLNSTNTHIESKKVNKINLPKSDVIIYTLNDNSKIAIRPSGTEPKIKFYFSVNNKRFKNNCWQSTEKELDKRIDSIISDLNL
ncbi:MAG: phospho-sugar mutase [Flavobacteriaceae bacterium]|nr:phospho-sugar mutase [Flavobacteriaceae bacterium]